MNSRERKEQRYLRRKNKREKKNIERNKKYGSIEYAFVFHKVMFYADKCCKGVGYKKSTQNFKIHLFTNIATTCRNIKSNNYNVGKTYKFIINERGKIRNIDAPHIMDRLIHKVLSNEIILPIYEPHIIYDNGASMKNKGFIFCMKRVKYKLYKWYKKYGLNGYVVIIDFSKFFPNCNHDIIHEIHKKYIYNDYTIKVIEDYLFISEGISLGVEIAQREACIVPNKLDHFIQNKGLMIERYMDDTFFLIENYETAKKVLEEYYIICKKLKLKINKKKTLIIPIKKYFKYCKWKYNINKNGKVICIPVKDTIYRQRRKLRRMIKLNVQINETVNSFKSYLNIGNSYKYIKHIEKIPNQTFNKIKKIY